MKAEKCVLTLLILQMFKFPVKKKSIQGAKKSLDSGVKRILILAIGYDVKETF